MLIVAVRVLVGPMSPVRLVGPVGRVSLVSPVKPINPVGLVRLMSVFFGFEKCHSPFSLEPKYIFFRSFSTRLRTVFRIH